MSSEYEEFIKTTDLKVDAEDDLQFYLDGYDEEHGEIHGVIKRMRRGDYDDLRDDATTYRTSKYLIEFGLKRTLSRFDKCREDLLKEIGDEHWYLTRFLQGIGITWDQTEKLNTLKLVERVKKNMIIGKGSSREE